MGKLSWGLCCLGVFSLTIGLSCAHGGKEGSRTPAEGQAVSMRVLWTVSQYIMGPDALWTEDQARAMLFKPLDMDERSITFDGRTCTEVTFLREPGSVDRHLSTAFGVTPDFLGIEPGDAVLVRTNCRIPGFDTFLRLADRRLIVKMGGIFFFLEPHVNY